MRAVKSLPKWRNPTSNMLRFLKSLFAAGIVMLSCEASAGELIVHTLSAHFRPRDTQNNRNFGIGYRADMPCLKNERFKNNVMAGVFHNTYHNPSAYAGCYVNLYEQHRFEFGMMIGLVTGYDRPIVPSGLLIGSYHVTSAWSVRISLAPVTRGVANLAIGYRF